MWMKTQTASLMSNIFKGDLLNSFPASYFILVHFQGSLGLFQTGLTVQNNPYLFLYWTLVQPLVFLLHLFCF